VGNPGLSSVAIGIRQWQVSRWRAALQDEDAYRDSIIHRNQRHHPGRRGAGIDGTLPACRCVSSAVSLRHSSAFEVEPPARLSASGPPRDILDLAQYGFGRRLTTGRFFMASTDRIRLHQSSPRWRTRRATPAELARSYGVGKSTISRLMP
jgi:hypothetical protein